MPAKSRHGKGKYAFQNKQRGASRPGTPEQQQTAHAQQSSPVATATVAPKTSSPRPSKSAPVTKTPIRNPYVSKELRTIGIVAGAVLVILVILAVLLR